MNRKRDPVYVGWIVFLLFLLLCGAALLWAGVLKGKPLPRVPVITALADRLLAGAA